jgi:hypothetical protein
MKRFLTRQAAWAIVAFLALVCSTIPTHAVGPTGKIVGTVTDPSGAPVAGAKVTVINEGTNESRAAISDDGGDVTFPILPVGNYTVKVEATGFEGYLQKGIVLQVDQNISVLAHLKVGSNTEVVQVTGDTGQNVDLVDATMLSTFRSMAATPCSCNTSCRVSPTTTMAWRTGKASMRV